LPSKPSGGRAALVQQVRVSPALRDSCRRQHLFRRNIPDLALFFLALVYVADSKHVASTERYNFINCLNGGCVYLCSVSTGLQCICTQTDFALYTSCRK